MTTNISNYLGDKVLNWLIASGSFPAAPTLHVYASLWNGDPDGAGSELTGANGLTRQDVHAALGAVSGHALTSSGTINFGTSSSVSPLSLTYVALHDASSSGNLLGRINISTITINNGQAVEILSGNLVVNHSSNSISNYLGDALLNWLIGTTFPANPTIYASLWNGDPDAGGTEITGTLNLTRQLAATALGVVTAHQLVSGVDIIFGTANGAGTATYAGFHDASSSGNLLCRASITSLAIANGEIIKIPLTDVTIAH